MICRCVRNQRPRPRTQTHTGKEQVREEGGGNRRGKTQQHKNNPDCYDQHRDRQRLMSPLVYSTPNRDFSNIGNLTGCYQSVLPDWLDTEMTMIEKIQTQVGQIQQVYMTYNLKKTAAWHHQLPMCDVRGKWPPCTRGLITHNSEVEQLLFGTALEIGVD